MWVLIKSRPVLLYLPFSHILKNSTGWEEEEEEGRSCVHKQGDVEMCAREKISLTNVMVLWSRRFFQKTNEWIRLTVLCSNCFVCFLEEFEDRKKSFSCSTFDSFLAGLGRNWMAYKSISSCPFFWRVTSSWFRTRALILSLTSKGTGKVRNLNRSTKRNVIQWRKIHLSHLQF